MRFDTPKVIAKGKYHELQVSQCGRLFATFCTTQDGFVGRTYIAKNTQKITEVKQNILAISITSDYAFWLTEKENGLKQRNLVSFLRSGNAGNLTRPLASKPLWRSHIDFMKIFTDYQGVAYGINEPTVNSFG